VALALALALALAQTQTQAQAQQDADAHEPALNALATGLVLRILTPPAQRAEMSRALDSSLLATAVHSVQAKVRDDPDFKCHAALIEIDLLQALAKGQLATAAAKLQGSYAELHRRVAGHAHWAHVADQGDFLLTPYAQAHPGAQAKAALALLAWLKVQAGRGVPEG
jgi:hypothetical protein